MSVLLGALYKITAMGLVCGALLALCGGQKEILRLGCACAMVVLLLSIVQNTPLPLPDLSRYEGAVQQQVEDAQAKNRTILLEQTQAQLELWLAQQAADLQLKGSFTVNCDADANGNVTVRWVEGIYRGGPRENLVSLREMIRTQLSVTDGQILIREETS